MAIEVGTKVSGKVSGITNFGAFVDLENHKTGLVHISQVSSGFVNDIHDVLTVGDAVNVKIMSIGDDGKIALSIKAASDNPEQKSDRPSHAHHSHPQSTQNNRDSKPRYQSRPNNSRGNDFGNKKQASAGGASDFDSMMSGFLKESESRLSTLKHNTEGKRGGRGGRRS